MVEHYSSEDDFVRDYAKLNEEYQSKVDKYIKTLLRIQRIESGASAQLLKLERTQKAQILSMDKDAKVYHCYFCGKSQYDAERMIVAQNMVCICDECARICGEVLDQAEEESREEADHAEVGEEKE